MFAKVVSGGQTGVDRAALDVALELGLDCGGWCPGGRRAEDGPIPSSYPLTETPSPKYPVRTARNIRDSDGTLVLTGTEPSRGTALTIRLARRMRKPHEVANLADRPDVQKVRAWAKANEVRVLNVAGPRESESRGIYVQAVSFLRELLSGSAEP